MELFNYTRVFPIAGIILLSSIIFVSSESLQALVLRDLPLNSVLRYNYTGYLLHQKLTDRTDFIIELTPVYQWDIKPSTIEIWDEPLTKLFGEKALGKVLELDERTQLYQLPPADHDVTEEDRLKMMWIDSSYQNYCAERIGKVSLVDEAKVGARIVCTDDFYRDRCCGEVETCQCITATIGCTCISDDDHQRRMKMFNEAVQVGKDAKEKVVEIAKKIAKLLVTQTPAA